MPYDASKPANGAPIVSAELRDQFAALKSLIDARAARVDDVDAAGIVLSNTYDHSEVQAIADKLDELITKLQRL